MLFTFINIHYSGSFSDPEFLSLKTLIMLYLILLQRHRLINEALILELRNNIHALAIEGYSVNEWENSKKKSDQSPTCKGGFGL